MFLGLFFISYLKEYMFFLVVSLKYYDLIGKEKIKDIGSCDFWYLFDYFLLVYK